jgi:hypothetical protein
MFYNNNLSKIFNTNSLEGETDAEQFLKSQGR